MTTTDPLSVPLRRWESGPNDGGRAMISAALVVDGRQFGYSWPAPAGADPAEAEAEFRGRLAGVMERDRDFYAESPDAP